MIADKHICPPHALKLCHRVRDYRTDCFLKGHGNVRWLSSNADQSQNMALLVCSVGHQKTFTALPEDPTVVLYNVGCDNQPEVANSAAYLRLQELPSFSQTVC